MATRQRIKRLIRWVILGRKQGLRAWLRARAGAERSAASSRPVTPNRSSAAAAPGPSPMEGWTVLVSDAELSDGDVIEAMVGDRALAVARVGEEVYALDNVCPHAGGPLGDGTLDGCELTCPWHGWQYDVESGQNCLTESICQTSWPVEIENGHVTIELP